MSDLPPRPAPEEPSYAGQRTDTGRRVLLIGGGIFAALLVLGGATWAVVSFTSDDAPDSVEGVVERAVEAANDQDVDALLALVCDDSALLDVREQAEDANERIDDALDGEDPGLSYEIESVEDGVATVRVDTAAAALDGSFAELVITTQKDGDSYCVADIEATDSAYTG